MTARIVANDVKLRLADQYDGSTQLTSFITGASLLADKVSTNDSDSLLSDADLAEIELLLACHNYMISRQMLESTTVGRATDAYRGQTAMGLDYTPYGQMAKMLDVTGYLAKLDMPIRPKAGSAWLGKPVSGQTDYIDRD